jgi:hypothetical protein
MRLLDGPGRPKVAGEHPILFETEGPRSDYVDPEAEGVSQEDLPPFDR